MVMPMLSRVEIKVGLRRVLSRSKDGSGGGLVTHDEDDDKREEGIKESNQILFVVFRFRYSRKDHSFIFSLSLYGC